MAKKMENCEICQKPCSSLYVNMSNGASGHKGCISADRRKKKDNEKMKTKTIDVWVDPVFLKGNCSSVLLDKMKHHPNQYKAKIIIEIPDKKVEISEIVVESILYRVGCGEITPDDAMEELGFNK